MYNNIRIALKYNSKNKCFFFLEKWYCMLVNLCETIPIEKC